MAKAKPKQTGKLRLEWMDPASLADNPKNWRTHPEAQRGALSASLAKVGWAGALLYNERTGHLIDGHARKEVTPDGKVPVLVGSWTEEEEALILATLDPLAAMAETNNEVLAELLRAVQTDGNPHLDALLRDLASKQGITPPDFQPVGIEEQGRLDEKAKITCPECGYEFTP